MPEILGTDPDGAVRVRRDDGQVVRVAPQGLPPGLQQQAQPPAPTGRQKLLRPRDDGQSFDVLELVDEPGQRGYNHSVVSPAQAVKLNKEGGYRLVGNDSAEPPEVQEAFMRVRGAEAIAKQKESPLTALKDAGGRVGNLAQYMAENAADAGRLTVPGYGPMATANEYLSPSTQAGVHQATQEAGQAVGTAARSARQALSEQFPNVVSPPPEPPKAQAPKQLTGADFALPTGPAQAPATPGAPTSAAAAAASLVPSFRPTGAAPVPGTQKLEKAYTELQATAAERSALEFQRANAEAARQEAEVQSAEQREARRLEREAQRQAFLQKSEEDLRSAMLETEKSPGEVDPNRWWNSRSTGQKVLAGVAAFMTGFAGTANPITEAIQQDLAVQRDNLDRKAETNRTKLQNRTGLLSLMRERFSDEIAAERAAEVAALGLAQQRAQLLATRSAGDEAKVRAKELVAQIEVTKQEKLGEFRQRMAQLSLQQDELQLRAAGLRLDAMAQAAKLPQVADSSVGANTTMEQLTPEQRERWVPGYGIAKDKEAAKEGTKLTTAYSSLDNVLKNLVAWREKYGAEKLDRGALQEGNTYLGELQLALKEAKALGTLDKGSEAFLEKLAGADAGAVGYVLPRLKALQKVEGENFRKALYSRTGIRTSASTFTPTAQ